MRRIIIAATVAALAGCATTPAMSPWPTASITATGETDPVGTQNADAADDPAVWRNAANPAQSFLVGTDKKAGLYAYGLDGSVKSFLAAGALNNVDLVEVGGTVLIGASDRGDLTVPHIALFTLDTATGQLASLARLPVGSGEAYGFCMGPGRAGELARAYVVTKEGVIVEAPLTGTIESPAVGTTREMRVATQPEGCVVDPRSNMLYVGEEAAGIWRFDLSQDSHVGELVASADGLALVPDVEGLALAPNGEEGGYLIASSQGDNAYALFQLPGMEYAGRFRIADGEQVDGTVETDGIEFAPGNFGPRFPNGLFIAQDGDNGNGTQNFKLVDGAKVLSVARAR